MPNQRGSHPMRSTCVLAVVATLFCTVEPTLAQSVDSRTSLPAAVLKPVPQMDRPFSMDRLRQPVDAASRYVLPALDRTAADPEPGITKRRIIGTVRTFPFGPLTLDQRIADDRNIGALEVVASGAARVRLHFEDFDLQDGVAVYVCSQTELEECHGPYEGQGPFDNGSFWTPPLMGESALVLVTKDEGSEAAPPPLKISEVSHTYPTGLDAMQAGIRADAGSCNLQVPTEWQLAAQSVGALDFISTPHEVWCTGTLLNSQAQDATPYFLTANHCLSTSAEAQSLRIWWRFESSSQTLSARPRSDVATLLSTSSTSDYTLLMILGALPDSLSWAGWTTGMPASTTSIVGLHHPNGDSNDADAYTRYSIGTIITNCPCTGSLACGNFLSVDWNLNGGVTEPGSSGSGLFLNNSSNFQIVGQLYGGCSACGNSNDDDHYGRFDLSYNHIGAQSSPHYLAVGRDDVYENNESSLTAAFLSAGTYSNLVVKSTDFDWYRVSVPAGQGTTFTINFTHAYGDVELELYKDAVFENGSYGIGNSESIQYNNTTASAVDLYFRIYLATGTRNTYSATVTATATPAITLDASDPNATEAGPTTGTATVIRTGSTASALTVSYTISGTAGNGSDYSTLSGSVTIPAGLASTPITVTPIDDAVLESAETVTITLASGAGYAIGSPSTATVTITDNDASITVTASDSTATEAGPTTGTFALARTGSTTLALTVNYSLGGTAGNSVDYNTLAGNVVIPSGSSSVNVVLTPIPDSLAEGPESASLTISSSSNYQVGSPSSATITIADAFGPPSNVVATATGPTSVQITWTAGPGAASYRVYRSANAVSYSLVGSPSASPFSDSSAAANTGYLYKVRSYGGSESSDSNRDLATTVIFTDPVITSASTTVKAAHLTELLTAVNAVRTLAGLGTITFSAQTPAAGLAIQRQQLIDLRNGIDPARSLLGLSALSYAESSITAGLTTIKNTHITELRNGTK